MTDLEKRKKVWLCLSESYLDVAWSDKDYQLMAKQLRSSGFSLPELMAIDLLEVYPVLQFNLMNPAGVWTGFEEDWLLESCTAYYRTKRSRLDAFRMRWRLLLSAHRRDYWKKIGRLMHQNPA